MSWAESTLAAYLVAAALLTLLLYPRLTSTARAPRAVKATWATACTLPLLAYTIYNPYMLPYTLAVPVSFTLAWINKRLQHLPAIVLVVIAVTLVVTG